MTNPVLIFNGNFLLCMGLPVKESDLNDSSRATIKSVVFAIWLMSAFQTLNHAMSEHPELQRAILPWPNRISERHSLGLFQR